MKCCAGIPDNAFAGLEMREKYLAAFRWMLLARLLDEKFASLYRGGKIHGGVFIGRGQEALSVSIGIHLHKGDIFAPLIRDGAGRLAFGEPVLDAVRTYMGSPLGPMRARDGNVHRGRPQEGLLPMISHLGAMLSVVTGMLFARRLKGMAMGIGVASIGEGGTSTGAFHEALNQAAVEHLPLVVVIADNQYAYSTPNTRQYACRSLLDRAVGYGFKPHAIEGTDLDSCLSGMAGAILQARQTSSPQLVVAKLLRLCGHGEHDDAQYIDPALKHSPLGRDCLKVCEEILIERGWANMAQQEGWRKEAQLQIDEALSIAQREAPPDPYQEKWITLSTTHLVEIQS